MWRRWACIRVTETKARNATKWIVNVRSNFTIWIFCTHESNFTLFTFLTNNVCFACTLTADWITSGRVIQRAWDVTVTWLASPAGKIEKFRLTSVTLFAFDTMVTLALTINITLSVSGTVLVTAAWYALVRVRITIKSRFTFFTKISIRITLTVDTSPVTKTRIIDTAIS